MRVPLQQLGSYPNTVPEFQYQYRKCRELQFAFCTRQPSIKCVDFDEIYPFIKSDEIYLSETEIQILFKSCYQHIFFENI